MDKKNRIPDQAILLQLYPSIRTLRQYLLAQTDVISKSRRRKLDLLDLPTRLHTDQTQQIDQEVAHLLDTTLIASLDPSPLSFQTSQQRAKEYDQDVADYSQQRTPTPTATVTNRQCEFLSQSEIVDFVIWCLFKRTTSHQPTHLLCHGFQRGVQRSTNAFGPPAGLIPGLTETHTNSSVQALKSPSWCRLHALLSPRGHRAVIGLLLDCSIFVALQGNMGNFYQLSGIPLYDVTFGKTSSPSLSRSTIHPEVPPDLLLRKREKRKPGAITFVRSRMLYARAILTARGEVQFGLCPMHALNHLPNSKHEEQTAQILRYIFPRQFGLHNVFTSNVEPHQCAMPFKDYTSRENEIRNSMNQPLNMKCGDPRTVKEWRCHTPKRLRGAVTAWVSKLLVHHRKCSYSKLLHHYCSINGVPLPHQPPSKHFTNKIPTNFHDNAGALKHSDTQHLPQSKFSTFEQTCVINMACPVAHISAFCRAVVAMVIPECVWGAAINKHKVMYWIDQFIVMRRFESLTLHQVTQDLQTSTFDWLNLTNIRSHTNLSKTDFEKRKEILLEFIYWLFDSYLMTLIRSNFYVTESNVHRNRLFYFRHDVWRSLTEPTWTTLKSQMFDEVPMEKATKLLSARQLGSGKIRLLPKNTGFRTIMNLKRRQQIIRNGVASLGRSINSVMSPVFHVMTYEKSRQINRFGSSLFSVGDMLPSLAAFKASVVERNSNGSQLYFAKVDIRSCFDTIPQGRLLAMANSLMTLQDYTIGKHVEVSLSGALQHLDGKHASRAPIRRYVAHSGSIDEAACFSGLVERQLVGSKAHTVFINTNWQRRETKDDLIQLLRHHVKCNLVKIGKKYYRQTKGIPQGSVLSSILCNLLYAELERDILDFTREEDCLLLRLLDDFLLISTNRSSAERFMRLMHRGQSEYGIAVQVDKSLTNFDMTTDAGEWVPSLPVNSQFPYCGVWIDMRTLEVGKMQRARKADIRDSLTVELSKVPGQTLHRKALNAFKLQLKNILIDTTLNSDAVIIKNLYRCFHEAAVRCLEYVRAISRVHSMRPSLMIRTVDNMITLALFMCRRNTRSHKNSSMQMSELSRRQLQLLACTAFHVVFERQQTQHAGLLVWLKVSLFSAYGPGIST